MVQCFQIYFYFVESFINQIYSPQMSLLFVSYSLNNLYEGNAPQGFARELVHFYCSLLSNVFEWVPKSHNFISTPQVNEWSFKLLYPYKRNNKSQIRNSQFCFLVKSHLYLAVQELTICSQKAHREMWLMNHSSRAGRVLHQKPNPISDTGSRENATGSSQNGFAFVSEAQKHPSDHWPP